MNLIGESFDDFVGTQVNLRQKFYGTLSPDFLSGSLQDIVLQDKGREQYLYNKKPFIKLISSVDVEAAKLKDLGLSESLAGSGLAKSFVLFAGTSEFKGLISGSQDQFSFRAGLNSGVGDQSLLGSSAYGLGGLEFGQVPMPGITSATVSYKNRGSLKTATINIIAHNRTQLNIIDALYLRLGYTVLLEWGWGANYLNNNGEVVPQIRKTLANEFLDGTSNSGNILNKITQERKKSSGNYDALYGTITNFNWSFNPDGTYDITISLVSVGNIIESLTINDLIGKDTILTSDGFQEILDDVKSQLSLQNVNTLKINGKTVNVNLTTQNNTSPGGTGGIGAAIIGTGKVSTTVLDSNGKILFSSKTGYNDEAISALITRTTGLVSKTQETDLEIGVIGSNAGLNSLTYYLYKEIQLGLDSNEAIKHSERVSVLKDDNKTLAFKINWEESPNYYIKFRTLLNWIQNNLIYDNVNDANKTKAITFDLNISDNLIYKNKYSVATDFTKVVTRNMGYPNFNTKTSSDTINLLDLPDDVAFISDINPNAGKLMNVFLNLVWLVETLKSNVDDEGNISLFRFLQAICQGINSSLGHVNSLDVVVDEETNQIKFIDDKPIPGILKDLNKNTTPTEFQVYAFSPVGNNLNGSFIRDFSIRTEITNKLATTLSIGAQALNAVVTENATALQSWNEGLTDRTAKIKQDATQQKVKLITPATFGPTRQLGPLTTTITQAVYAPEPTPQPQTAFEKYKPDIINYVTLLKKYEGKNLSKDKELSQLNNLNKNWQKFWSQTIAEADNKASPNGVGFIPINLNLTMDGLSGMKIYQTFIINSKFLPLNYPTKLQFLIKGISHNIDRDSWTTQIETFSIPKEITSESPQGTSESQAPDTSGTEEEISALVAPKFVLPIKGGQARGDDCAGSGAYGAGRDRAVSAKYPDGKGPHEGYDIKIFEAVSIPVYAPISGKLVSSTPYTNDGPLYVKDRPKNQLNDVNQGFKIKGTGEYKGILVKVWYLSVNQRLLGKEVEVGQVVGNTIPRMNYARKSGGGYKYPNCMTPHVHYQVSKDGKITDPTPGKGLVYDETLYKV